VVRMVASCGGSIGASVWIGVMGDEFVVNATSSAIVSTPTVIGNAGEMIFSSADGQMF